MFNRFPSHAHQHQQLQLTVNSLAFSNPIYVSLAELKLATPTKSIHKKHTISCSKSNTPNNLGPAPTHRPPPPPKIPPRILNRPHVARKRPPPPPPPPTAPLYQNVYIYEEDENEYEQEIEIYYTNEELAAITVKLCQHSDNSSTSAASSNATMIIHDNKTNQQQQQHLSSTVNTAESLSSSENQEYAEDVACMLLIDDDDSSLGSFHLPAHHAHLNAALNRTLKSNQNHKEQHQDTARFALVNHEKREFNQRQPAVAKKSIASFLSPIMTSSRADLHFNRGSNLGTMNTPAARPPISHIFNSLPSRISAPSTAKATNSLPRPIITTTFSNGNYFYKSPIEADDNITFTATVAEVDNSSASASLSSSLSSLSLPQPPSPFKTAPPSTIAAITPTAPSKPSIHSILNLNRQPGTPTSSSATQKRVSFMLANLECNNGNKNQNINNVTYRIDEVEEDDEPINAPITSTDSSSTSSTSSSSSDSSNKFDNDSFFGCSIISAQQPQLPQAQHYFLSPSQPLPKQQLKPQQQNHSLPCDNNMHMLQERIFAKIFANEDYFLSSSHRIESASATSIQSTCSSASSSSSSSSSSCASSGYKSNQSSNLSSVAADSLTAVAKSNGVNELDGFIEANRERLDRLKVKRAQLVSTIISQSDIVELVQHLDQHSDEDEDSILFRNSSNSNNGSEEVNNSSGVMYEADPIKNGTGSVSGASQNSSVDTMIVKSESIRLFQKLFSSPSNVRISRATK